MVEDQIPFATDPEAPIEALRIFRDKEVWDVNAAGLAIGGREELWIESGIQPEHAVSHGEQDYRNTGSDQQRGGFGVSGSRWLLAPRLRPRHSIQQHEGVAEVVPVDPIPLFELNPLLDRTAAAEQFAHKGRVQIRDFLTEPAARTIHRVLAHETPWGIAWRAASEGPYSLRSQELATLAAAERNAMGAKITTAMRGRDYAFLYAQYPMLDAYLQRWGEHDALDKLVEHINSEPLLELVRKISGVSELKKGDAQATLYAPNHFLAQHDDSHVAEGWRIAYVMNFCAEDWRPDWGGYLLFYDDDGDVIAGFRPRFNALNLFRVPQKHSVTYVPPFAPVARFAITGWFRDR